MSEVRFGRDGNVATITLDRPGDANRLTRPVLLGLLSLVDELAADSEVQAVVITGSGSEFFSIGILAHPAVKQAYVVGVSDRDRGEVGVAAVELREGAMATAEALTAFCRERLASYKVPARIVFRNADEFPRTATGKVQKPRLRDDLERLYAGDGAR